MDDQNLKASSSQLLRQFGFAVTEIPKSEHVPTPDFHAEKGGMHFMIELKSREDDEKRLETERQTLKAGKVASKTETTNRTNIVSGIVRDAVEQLQDYSTPPGAFKVVWLHASGSDPELQFMQFRGSLYGLCDIFDMSEERDNRVCYYFDFNDFFRYRTVLDGAMLTTDSQLQVCINDFSLNAEQFRGSTLVEAFRGGIVDPSELERQGCAYVADCDHDRRDKRKIIAYIQEKYGKQLLRDISLQKATAMIQVPRLK